MSPEVSLTFVILVMIKPQPSVPGASFAAYAFERRRCQLASTTLESNFADP